MIASQSRSQQPAAGQPALPAQRAAETIDAGRIAGKRREVAAALRRLRRI